MNHCDMCDEAIYPHGWHICLNVRGIWRLYRVCEECNAVYLHLAAS
jgi:hypothetical protein